MTGGQTTASHTGRRTEYDPPGVANLDSARRELETGGVTLLRQLATPELLGDLRAAVAANRDARRPLSRQVLYTKSPPPPDRPPLTALMNQWLNPFRIRGAGSTSSSADALRPLASALLGKEAVLFQDLLLVKKPGQRPFPWHQDFGYWPIDRPAGVVLWVPLQPSDTTSGALRFALGSQTLGPQPVVDLHNGAPQDLGATLAFDPDEWPMFSPRFEEGDLVAFTPLTFHASPAMTRNADRGAWSCIFLSPDARWRHASAPNHPICQHVPDGAPVSEAFDA